MGCKSIKKKHLKNYNNNCITNAVLFFKLCTWWCKKITLNDVFCWLYCCLWLIRWVLVFYKVVAVDLNKICYQINNGQVAAVANWYDKIGRLELWDGLKSAQTTMRNGFCGRTKAPFLWKCQPRRSDSNKERRSGCKLQRQKPEFAPHPEIPNNARPSSQYCNCT